MTNPTHEIYDSLSGDVVGTAVQLEDGDLAITIGTVFNGVFRDFETWNLGKDYRIRRLERSITPEEMDLEIIDFDAFDFDDQYSFQNRKVVDNYGTLELLDDDDDDCIRGNS